MGRRPGSRGGTSRGRARTRRSRRAPGREDVLLGRGLSLPRQPGDGPPVAVWIDLTDERRVHVDTGWFRSHGLRASVSHRVVFCDVPVIARFGTPGALSEQPWFSRDALRTAASWAGMADTAADAALDELAGRPGR